MPTSDSPAPESHPVPNSPSDAPGQFLDIEHVDLVFATLGNSSPEPAPNPILIPVYRRKIKLPLLLFFATLASTFLAGASRFQPNSILVDFLFGDTMTFRRAVWSEWQNGLLYMASIVSILLSHELGHFFMTLRYRIPATFPFFIPFPINSIGTMGAVIGMDGSRADRKQIFDIGIAGPLAGLVFAIPLVLMGAARIDFTLAGTGPIAFDLPWGLRLFLDWLSPVGYEATELVYLNQLNPMFMAGWAGLLVTGLNMLPVSQLDGGHVIYCLLGRAARWFSRAFLVFAIAYVFYANVVIWMLMLSIVILIGPDHPPTRDDSVRLGAARTLLGWCSWLIPLLCFPVNPFRFN